MKTAKYVVLGIVGAALFAGYVAGASFIAGLLQQQTPAEDLKFGTVSLRVADSDTDADGVSVFDSTDKRLLFEEREDLLQRKLFALYYVYAEPESAFPVVPETVMLTIDKDHARSSSLTVIKIGSDGKLTAIDSVVKSGENAGENGEQSSSPVLIFAVDEPGYYGLAAQRTQAHHAGRVVFISLATATVLYALLFFALKPRGSKGR